MNEWNTFFSAILGAAATLTGLIFVGVSISLSRILAIPKLPDRALASLTLLLTVLVSATLCLVPGQPTFVAGVEILFIGVIAWFITWKLDRGVLHKTDPAYKTQYRLNILLTQLAVLPYIISGVITLGIGSAGIYWLIPGIIFSFIKAVIDAWVLLVEINR